MAEFFFIDGINPEPWQASQFARSGGKSPNVYKPEGLRAYQEAVRSEFVKRYGQPVPVEGECSVTFCFWRELASYNIGDDQKSLRQHADATNMQKATEDALQGLLYVNDSTVIHVESWVMAQGPDVNPGILIVFRKQPPRPPREYQTAAEAMRIEQADPIMGNIRPSFDLGF